MASDLEETITSIRARIASGPLPEDSRRALLQAAKDLQYELETPINTVNRYTYSAYDLVTTRIFHEVKVFDILIDLEPTAISTDELAKRTNTDPVLLGRLLRYAASNRAVKQVGVDTWTACKLTHNLNAPNSQIYVRSASVTILPYFADIPGFFARTNYQNPIDPVHTVHQFKFGNDGTHWFDWAKREENSKVYEAMNALMAVIRYAKSGVHVFPFEEKIPSLFQSDFNSSEKPLFVDIGGGRGQMCRAFRDRFPDLKGRVIFQDLPHTIAEAGTTPGIEGMAHDFFTPQPIKGAKIYFLRYVLHDWPDAKAEAILRRVIEAMGTESVILINEKILQDIGTSTMAAGLDLQMMAIFASQERSEKEWKALLGRVGLKVEYLMRYQEEEGDGVMLVRRA